MQVQELLDKQLLKEQEDRKGKIPSGLINPSTLGQCFRRQYYYYKQVPETNPPDMLALRKMYRGRIFHDFIQGLMEGEKEVEITTAQLHGFVDVVFEDEIVEIKSQGTRTFWHSHKSEKPLIERNPDYILQALAYATTLNKDFFRLVFVDCETMSIEEYRMAVTGELAEKLTMELATIDEIRLKDWFPEPLPRLYGGKECKYCRWASKCKEDGNGM
jgi:CRISPR/Cas system-associated exonuclease Cas4 (RecB family)